VAGIKKETPFVSMYSVRILFPSLSSSLPESIKKLKIIIIIILKLNRVLPWSTLGLRVRDST
jgi:hypothetical protein